jgi:molybdenum cofactor cytidylyltransferase
MDNIWTIVLAAGASERMGQPKMLLPFDGKNILGKVVDTAVEVTGAQVVVVLDERQEEILINVRELFVSFTFNPDPSQGMLSSVISGLNALPETTTAFFLFLGDQPQIQAKVAQNLKESWMKDPGGILIPVYGGKRGHPVLISIRYQEEIKNLPAEYGLKGLMLRHPGEIRELECGAPEILRDIDTPADYRYETGLIDHHEQKNQNKKPIKTDKSL